jgi:hypothetical protein
MVARAREAEQSFFAALSTKKFFLRHPTSEECFSSAPLGSYLFLKKELRAYFARLETSPCLRRFLQDHEPERDIYDGHATLRSDFQGLHNG